MAEAKTFPREVLVDINRLKNNGGPPDFIRATATEQVATAQRGRPVLVVRVEGMSWIALPGVWRELDDPDGKAPASQEDASAFVFDGLPDPGPEPPAPGPKPAGTGPEFQAWLKAYKLYGEWQDRNLHKLLGSALARLMNEMLNGKENPAHAVCVMLATIELSRYKASLANPLAGTSVGKILGLV